MTPKQVRPKMTSRMRVGEWYQNSLKDYFIMTMRGMIRVESEEEFQEEIRNIQSIRTKE